MTQEDATFTAFAQHDRLEHGTLTSVALAVRRAVDAGDRRTILVFDDRDGRVVDLDLRGSDEEIAARLESHGSAPRRPGRPKLGVVGREVTLLPRHWDWLERQPGGASVALRRLVDAARGGAGAMDRVREYREAAYRFMTALAGDLPGYEEATRALFGGDRDRFVVHTAPWPADVRAHALRLGFPGGSTRRAP